MITCTLLHIQHVHDRLVHGSDYPVPAINLVIHTSRLRRYTCMMMVGGTLYYSLWILYTPSSLFLHLSLPLPLPSLRFGLITADQCRALNELYHYNPLLFDFATKRVLRGPNGESFPVSIFKQHPLLPPSREPTVSSVDPPHAKAEVNSDSSYVHRPVKVTTEVHERS